MAKLRDISTAVLPLLPSTLRATKNCCPSAMMFWGTCERCDRWCARRENLQPLMSLPLSLVQFVIALVSRRQNLPVPIIHHRNHFSFLTKNAYLSPSLFIMAFIKSIIPSFQYDPASEPDDLPAPAPPAIPTRPFGGRTSFYLTPPTGKGLIVSLRSLALEMETLRIQVYKKLFFFSLVLRRLKHHVSNAVYYAEWKTWHL